MERTILLPFNVKLSCKINQEKNTRYIVFSFIEFHIIPWGDMSHEKRIFFN